MSKVQPVRVAIERITEPRGKTQQDAADAPVAKSDNDNTMDERTSYTQ